VPPLLKETLLASEHSVAVGYWNKPYCRASGCVQGQEDESQRMHRLAPQYVHDINSPLRHVRTRIYFTSESHIHSLVNILRYSQLNGESLVSEEAQAQLDNTTEFDYLTQIVIRMYENQTVRLSHARTRE
jgi:hypothetical protein